MKYKVYVNRQFLSHENAHDAYEGAVKAIQHNYEYHKKEISDPESVFFIQKGREKTFFTAEELKGTIEEIWAEEK